MRNPRALIMVAASALAVGGMFAASPASAGKPNPPPPATTSIIQFQNASYSFTEGNSDIEVAVQLIRNVSGSVATVVVSAADGTGATSADWGPAGSQTVTFDTNQTGAPAVFTIKGDLLDENTETVKLSLVTTSLNAQLGKRKTATMSILDNDPSPSVSAANASALEGSPVQFTVALSSASPVLPISVKYTAVPGTASAADFTATTGTLVWGPADTSTRSVSVPTTSGDADEPDQTFTLVFSNLVNVSGGAPATGTILDNTAPPTVTLVGEGPVWEGGVAMYHAVISAVSEFPITADLNTWDITDPAGWYTPTIGTVTIPAGSLTSNSMSVTTLQNTASALNRDLWVEVTGATHATIVNPWGEVTVKDDDPSTVNVVNDAPIAAFAAPPPDNQIVTVSATVVNLSGDALDGQLVRFENFRDTDFGGGFQQIDIGGYFDPVASGYSAAFAYSGSSAAAGGAPVTAVAGRAIFGPANPAIGFIGYTNYGQLRLDEIVACVVPNFTAPCGVTGADPDTFVDEDTVLNTSASPFAHGDTSVLWLP
jgi:hypothetical protein